MKTAERKFRERAVRDDASFIVQAPAGSGKTELLTQRFLRLLSTVEKPERVLAITFTRKATQEMRERIMLRLRQAGDGKPVEDEHEMLAVGFASKVLAKSLEQGWNLLENPGRLQIHTIDGLCARISGRAPQPGDGVAGLTVLDDARPLYLKAARRLIEDTGRENADPDLFDALSGVLVYLQGSASALQDMVCSMLGRREQWLNRLGVRSEDMAVLLASRQIVELQSLRDALGQDLLDLLAESLELMAAISGDTVNAQLLLSAMHEAKADPTNPNLAARAAFRLLKLVANNANKPFSPTSVKSRVLPTDGNSNVQQLDSIKKILATWNDSESASLAFRRFVSTPPLAPSDDAWSVLGDFQLLLKFATAELRVLFTEEGKADFIYVSEMALQALGDELFPGDALLFEDGSLQHILLDEFQDTSHTQYELVKKLVSGWQLGDGRSLFLVGDPMQSIYRFRKADVGIFNRVFESGFLGSIPIEPLRLSSNFRSAPAIIDWVNAQFPQIFTQPVNQSSNFVGYTAVQTERSESGQVLAHHYAESIGPEGEAELITDLVIETLESQADISIAILAKARVQLETIALALHRRKLSFEAVQVEDLSSRPVIADLLTILRAILHPADRIAWLSLLRAPWCALNPQELLLVAGSSAEDEILSRISDVELLSGISKDRKARLLALYEIMSAAIEARDRVQISRLVEVAWLRLKGPFVVGSRAELDNAALFFKLLSSIEDEHPEDLLTAVLDRMENFYSESKRANLKLMTIHKAKGLEFDVVILPGLQKGRHRTDIPLLRIQELQLGEKQGVLMAPRKRKDAADPGLYDYLGLLESEQEAFEACRVFYVAATRARSELHVFGGWKWNKKEQRAYCGKGTFMSMLWPFFEQQIDIGDEPETVAPGSDKAPPLLPQLFLQNEPALAIDAEEQAPMHDFPELRIPDPDSVALGQAFHTWMELIHDHWDAGWSSEWVIQNRRSFASTLLAAGAWEQNLELLLDKLVFMIGNVLQDRESQDIVSPEAKAGSWAELAFVSREGAGLQRHILDRLFLDQSGEFSIVDYKTGAGSPGSEGDWQTQLDRYTEIVKLCTGGEVKLARIYQSKVQCST